MVTYARIRSLTRRRNENIDQTFRRLAELLRNSRRTATVRCTILIDDRSRSWNFELRGRDCRVRNDTKQVPDLEVVTGESTWWEIAHGRLSPLEAFLQGRLRILGDTDLGSRLLRHVTGSGGKTSLCGE